MNQSNLTPIWFQLDFLDNFFTGDYASVKEFSKIEFEIFLMLEGVMPSISPRSYNLPYVVENRWI